MHGSLAGFRQFSEPAKSMTRPALAQSVPQSGGASTKPRIALIGPILPFRGGIAQHTTMLHRALTGCSDLLTISFSRQYPRGLFPGESDRDPAYADHREAGVRYHIDSLNPLSWRRAVRAIREFAPAGVILPWWSVYWTFCFHHIAAAVTRAGIPLVFVCHNPIEHEDAAWKRTLSAWVLGTTDRFVVHDRHGRQALLERFPKARVLVHPHPVHGHFPAARGSLPRRAGLELLFFGFVRPYKGLDLLLDAAALLRGKDIKLTIAGEFWSGLAEYRARIAALGLQEMVELLPRYHSEQETAELFARADVVVLPYRSATGSAVIPLAYHYGKPVIATEVGGLPDVVEHERTGLLVAPGSVAALAKAIEALPAARASQMRGAIQTLAASLTWDGFGKTVLDSLAPDR
jgi:glycosyltransferase involved in cell wall biosynthesis